MNELGLFLLLAVVFAVLLFGFGYVAGVVGVVDVMRRDDADLYLAWMDRREARAEARRERE